SAECPDPCVSKGHAQKINLNKLTLDKHSRVKKFHVYFLTFHALLFANHAQILTIQVAFYLFKIKALYFCVSNVGKTSQQ
ncbi:MAG: hypothetical protein RML38_10280, partial [Bacteroidia bacterium]|nr:hypothetical protein [Bacteroidia bacterium]